MLYCGFVTVCIGVAVMEGPKEIWGNSPPPVSPAVQCTMNLTTQFFAIYLAIAVVRTVIQLQGRSELLDKLENLLTLAKFAINSARMRALQIDPKEGNPQKWAQICFYLCTFSIFGQ